VNSKEKILSKRNASNTECAAITEPRHKEKLCTVPTDYFYRLQSYLHAKT